MEKVIGFYQVGEDVEVKIREGPSGDLDSYLVLLNQLREAMDHFNQFNPESIELVHLTDLFDTGMDALIREFRELLRKHSKPVHIATLHDIAVCEDIEGMSVFWSNGYDDDSAVFIKGLCVQICQQLRYCLQRW